MKIKILITCLCGLSLTVMAQQPAGTYNVKTDGTALGNGITNDTAAIQNALTAAKAAGKEVYFPNGTYLISANISLPEICNIVWEFAIFLHVVWEFAIGNLQ